jgi:hypothetical protein
MPGETVTVRVPYVEDEQRFLLRAVQVALAAHRERKNSIRQPHGDVVEAHTATVDMCRHDAAPTQPSGSLREIIYGLF